MTAYRALTIRQPWAGAIAHGDKTTENRTWALPDKHHGARILIHAAATPDSNAQNLAAEFDDWQLTPSAIVAVATITGCHWSDDGTCCGPWGFERTYHWTLTDVIALPEPVPTKGRLGIWTPDADLVAAVDAQVAAA